MSCHRLDVLARKRLVVDPFVGEELGVHERFDRAALHCPAALDAYDLFPLRRRRRDIFMLVKLDIEGDVDVKVLDAVEARLVGEEDSIAEGSV